MIVFAALMGVLAKVVYDNHLGDRWRDAMEFSFLPFTALGVTISLFLGAHNTASYGRWWEARTIWGTHIIDMRNFLRFVMGTLRSVEGDGSDESTTGVETTSSPITTMTLTVSSTNKADDIEHAVKRSNNNFALNNGWQQTLVRLAMAHAHATRHQLRKEPCPFDEGVSALHDRNRFLTLAQQHRVDAAPNPANEILQIMGEIVGQQQQQQQRGQTTHGGLDTYTRIHLMKLIDKFCVAQTACERIENTSLPFAYSLLVHRTSFLYIVLAPWALCSTMGYWTPVFMAILSYTFFGLDELARQLQEPFRVNEPNALALSAMCRTMERDVCFALHYPTIPPPLKPRHDSVLM
jgi:putative membrane protein